MAIFRAEYNVFSDLVFEHDNEIGVIFEGEDQRISLRNGPRDSEGHTTSLIGEVIAPAVDLRSAIREHRSLLADSLDTIALATRSRFKILTAIRVIDWDTGTGERRMLICHAGDGKYPPAPLLDAVALTTAKELSLSDHPPFLSRALKYYRLGLLEGNASDQFVRFWHALEIIAENTKENDRIPVSCHECKASLVCAECETASTRLPYPKEAIRELMRDVGVPDLASVFKRQLGARNTLMHGGSSERILQEHKVPLEAIVNELGDIAQVAILREVKFRDGADVTFVRGNDLSNMEVWAHAELSFDYQGSEPHPREDQIPMPTISMQYQWRGG